MKRLVGLLLIALSGLAHAVSYDDGGSGGGAFPAVTAGSVLFGQGNSPVTGSGVLTNGQLLIGDGSGAPSVGSLTGTSNEIVVTPGAGSITLTTPQDIDTASTPQFAQIGIGGAASTGFGVYVPFSCSAASNNCYGNFNYLTVGTAGTNLVAGQFNQMYLTGNGNYPAGSFGHYAYSTMDAGENVGSAGDHGTGTWGMRSDIHVPSGSTTTFGGGLYVMDTSASTGGERFGVYADTPSVTQTSWIPFVGIAQDNGTGMVLTIATGQAGVTTADNYILFKATTGTIGSIAGTGVAGTIAYNVTSDARLKENVLDALPSGDVIDSILVRSFDYIASGAHQRYGFIAQELEPVFPEAVSVGGDDVAEKPWQVDYSKLVPLLVKEIQGLRLRVGALENPQ